MTSKPIPTRRIPFWGVLILGSLITCIGTFLFLDYGPIFHYNSWIPLHGPPSGVAYIVDFVAWSGPGALSVRANNGNYYVTKPFSIEGSYEGPFLSPSGSNWPKWIPATDIPKIEAGKSVRGTSCTGLEKGVLPLNPRGVRECIYTYWEGSTTRTNFYIALMSNGSLKFWQREVRGIMQASAVMFSAALFIIVALLLASIWLFGTLLQRIQLHNESATRPGSSRESDSR